MRKCIWYNSDDLPRTMKAFREAQQEDIDGYLDEIRRVLSEAATLMIKDAETFLLWKRMFWAPAMELTKFRRRYLATSVTKTGDDGTKHEWFIDCCRERDTLHTLRQQQAILMDMHYKEDMQYADEDIRYRSGQQLTRERFGSVELPHNHEDDS